MPVLIEKPVTAHKHQKVGSVTGIQNRNMNCIQKVERQLQSYISDPN